MGSAERLPRSWLSFLFRFLSGSHFCRAFLFSSCTAPHLIKKQLYKILVLYPRQRAGYYFYSYYKPAVARGILLIKSQAIKRGQLYKTEAKFCIRRKTHFFPRIWAGENLFFSVLPYQRRGGPLPLTLEISSRYRTNSPFFRGARQFRPSSLRRDRGKSTPEKRGGLVRSRGSVTLLLFQPSFG